MRLMVSHLRYSYEDNSLELMNSPIIRKAIDKIRGQFKVQGLLLQDAFCTKNTNGSPILTVVIDDRKFSSHLTHHRDGSVIFNTIRENATD